MPTMAILTGSLLKPSGVVVKWGILVGGYQILITLMPAGIMIYAEMMYVRRMVVIIE